ncbi:MAG TPA: hypothetical protein VJT32_09350 [bacterium]|nr:hypothetical protein [bacterium]
MELRQFVSSLADMILERERQVQRPVDNVMLSYVQGAVAAQLEYRRRLRDLERRRAEFESTPATTGAS